MKKILTLILFFTGTQLFAQQRFTLRLEPSVITSAPAVHSGAFGAYNNKWFFIGGRKNGLHGFLPPSAFPETGVNDSIYITDPVANQQWSASTYQLPDTIREAINSSNMEFYLNDSMLYIVGGYGWQEAVTEFITFHTLTAINMKGLMNDLINAQPIASNFRQIKDSTLAVCGAHLQKMDSTYYLVFGQLYDGHYNRLNSNTSLTHQEYTMEVRKFQIADDGNNLSIYNYNALRDTANFRRRDYNLIPFLDPFRGEGLLAFSGVFRPDADLPYLNCIEIFKDTVIVRNDFNQNLSQYHSAVCPLYDSISMLQHNLFFGGMSMYYMDTLMQQTVLDTLVPFVRTISDVARDIDLNYHEFDAGIKMPALLGTNAYFFPELSVPTYASHFIHLNKLPHHQRIGFITGGIESLDLNIADNSPSAQSFASLRVYEVWLDTIDTGVGMNEVSNAVLNFAVYPNPVSETAQVEFELRNQQAIKIELLDAKGSLVSEVLNQSVNQGKQKLLLNMAAYSKGVYHCMITAGNQRKSIRLVRN